MVLLRGRRRGCVILLLSVCLCPSVACVAFVSHRSPVSYVSEQTSADASSTEPVLPCPMNRVSCEGAEAVKRRSFWAES